MATRSTGVRKNSRPMGADMAVRTPAIAVLYALGDESGVELGVELGGDCTASCSWSPCSSGSLVEVLITLTCSPLALRQA